MEINGLTLLSCFQICNSCSITAELPSWNHSVAATSIVPIPHKFCRNFSLTGKQDSKALQLPGCWKQEPHLAPSSPSWRNTGICFGRCPIEVINTSDILSVYLFCVFFLFSHKSDKNRTWRKKPEAEMGQTVTCYCKNIKRKLVHSTTSKLHMGSGLI